VLRLLGVGDDIITVPAPINASSTCAQWRVNHA
jgi:hypothetical protein